MCDEVKQAHAGHCGGNCSAMQEATRRQEILDRERSDFQIVREKFAAAGVTVV